MNQFIKLNNTKNPKANSIANDRKVFVENIDDMSVRHTKTLMHNQVYADTRWVSNMVTAYAVCTESVCTTIFCFDFVTAIS